MVLGLSLWIWGLVEGLFVVGFFVGYMALFYL